MTGLTKRNMERGAEVAENFSRLPRKAQELFFAALIEEGVDWERGLATIFLECTDISCSECESPIEMIFDVAFNLTSIMATRCKNIPISFWLQSQAPVKCNNKNYRADFMFNTEEYDLCDIKFENDYKLIIECDGHDFHEKTKAQVTKNNERDMDLKKAGYDVIHFNGSQIFNNPMKCANDTIDLIIENIGKITKVGDKDA